MRRRNRTIAMQSNHEDILTRGALGKKLGMNCGEAFRLPQATSAVGDVFSV